MDGIWENGGDVNTELSNTCIDIDIGDGMCKSEEGNNTKEFPRKPYSAPNPNFFAVLEKPGVNRHVMRGCFKTNKDHLSPWASQFGDTNLNLEWGDDVVCDDKEKTYCHENRDKCEDMKALNIPGGLADFTHPMPIHGSDFIKNGFIMDRCECSLDTEAFKKDIRQESKYSCWRDKRYRKNERIAASGADDCCHGDTNQICQREGYKIGNDNYSVGKDGPSLQKCADIWYPGSDWREYQPSELWDGAIDSSSGVQHPSACYNWYNPSLDELPDKLKDKNNCSQYLLKWAKSCKWCKENKPVNDAFRNCGSGYNECDGINKCGGKCIGGNCNGTLVANDDGDDPCKLCNSELWDHIPGGWEALVDESHPKHLMAKFAYVPKVVKVNQNVNNCKQPNANLVGGIPDLYRDDAGRDSLNNTKNTTTFTGLGPWKDDYVLNSRDETQNYEGNQPNNLFPNNSTACGELSWSQNLDIKHNDDPFGNNGVAGVCETDQNNQTNTNGIDTNNRSVWTVGNTGQDNNGNINDKLENCEFTNTVHGHENNPRSHTMCERNQNLTGYGECDTEVDHFAKLWLDGKWDLSKYTGANRERRKL
jgi:hypothetical protein